MSRRGAVVAAWCCLLLTATGAPIQAEDWRHQLLRKHGVALDEASLKVTANRQKIDAVAFARLLKQLGADRYPDRERAQQALIDEGEGVLAFLEAQPPIKDPEIRERVAIIGRALRAKTKSDEGLMVKWAAASLLKKPKDPATGGQFFEWFGMDSEECHKGYGSLVHEGGLSFFPYAKEGRLHIPGKHGGEEDQRLVLRPDIWPGAEVMPDQFEVSCLMGGTGGGAGTWHVGLCVGEVKVLFHPGYQGGALRFEQLGAIKILKKNQDMGFTPKTGVLHRMEVKVMRNAGKKVELRVVVTSSDGEIFEGGVVVSEADIGPIKRIGMERSGRRGGTAMFDEFRVKLGK